MGCASTRDDKQSEFKTNFSKIRELQENITQAIIACYARESPIMVTPIIKSHGNSRIYMKMENFQPSGSFKLRGAYFKIQKLYKQNVKDYLKNNISIVVASTGNHALACQCAASAITEKQESENKQLVQIDQQKPQETPTLDFEKLQPIQLVIMIPSTTSKYKQEELQKKGNSKIIIGGKDSVESEVKAREYANSQLLYYVSPYNDLDIIAGTATIGKEIEEWLVAKKTILDYIFIAVGGGGLIAGVAFYLKYMRMLNIKIIGV